MTMRGSVTLEGPVRLPEKSLLVAMLQRALLDYVGSQEVDRVDARNWLFAPPAPESEFSFCWVCQHLDINADQLLRRVGTMQPLCDSPDQSRRVPGL